jgi:hypothetical protein
MASQDREKIANEVGSTSENTESESNLDPQSLSDVDESKAISEFSFKLVNSVKSMNLGEISYYEMVNAFSLADELKCLYLFIRALPYDPIIPIYPETPFLFFKGVPIPRAFDISEEIAKDVENFMKGQNSAYYRDLRLHDLDQNYLDAYESAIRIYNDMLDKTRRSYQENVKLAKSQVMEISAVLVCLFVIIITIIGIS